MVSVFNKNADPLIDWLSACLFLFLYHRQCPEAAEFAPGISKGVTSDIRKCTSGVSRKCFLLANTLQVGSPAHIHACTHITFFLFSFLTALSHSQRQPANFSRLHLKSTKLARLVKPADGLQSTHKPRYCMKCMCLFIDRGW